MIFKWQIEQADVDCVKKIVDTQANNVFVEVRIEKNLADFKPKVDRSRFWKAMLAARMTSRQRAGPNSHLANFLRRNPFPLLYEKVHNLDRDEARSTIVKIIDGIGHYNTVAKEMSANLDWLNTDENWGKTLKKVNSLTTTETTAEEERKVACYLRERLNGLGPKQSRNVLQMLGLTRYEIPIDSRIMEWLDEYLRFPIPLRPKALADPEYYDFVLDIIQELCAKSKIYPAILDAAIFASNDGEGWTREKMIDW